MPYSQTPNKLCNENNGQRKYVNHPTGCFLILCKLRHATLETFQLVTDSVLAEEFKNILFTAEALITKNSCFSSWAQFCCKMWEDSLVWKHHIHRVDAEVKFYEYRFPILFFLNVLKTTPIRLCFILTDQMVYKLFYLIFFLHISALWKSYKSVLCHWVSCPQPTPTRISTDILLPIAKKFGNKLA